MWTCESCGVENVDTTFFCEKCGAPIPEEETVASDESNARPESWICARCGLKNKTEKFYCENCGEEIPEDDTEQPNVLGYEDQPATYSFVSLLDTVGAIVIFLGIIAFFALISKFSQSGLFSSGRISVGEVFIAIGVAFYHFVLGIICLGIARIISMLKEAQSQDSRRDTDEKEC